MHTTKPPMPPAAAAPSAAAPPPAGGTVAGAMPASAPLPAAPAPTAGVEALADSLSSCADELHRQIMRAVRQHQPGAGPTAGLAPAISQQAAQDLFDQEVLLRQSANRLYVQAAVLAMENLDSVRQEVLAVTALAHDTLRRVATVQTLVALAAALVTLAGALAAGKPEQWPAAVRALRARFNALHDDKKS